MCGFLQTKFVVQSFMNDVVQSQNNLVCPKVFLRGLKGCRFLQNNRRGRFFLSAMLSLGPVHMEDKCPRNQ